MAIDYSKFLPSQNQPTKKTGIDYSKFVPASTQPTKPVEVKKPEEKMVVLPKDLFIQPAGQIKTTTPSIIKPKKDFTFEVGQGLKGGTSTVLPGPRKETLNLIEAGEKPKIVQSSPSITEKVRARLEVKKEPEVSVDGRTLTELASEKIETAAEEEAFLRKKQIGLIKETPASRLKEATIKERREEERAQILTAPIRWTAGSAASLASSYALEKAGSEAVYKPKTEAEKLLIGEGEIKRLTKSEDVYGMIARGAGIPTALIAGVFLENPFLADTGIGKYLKNGLLKAMSRGAKKTEQTILSEVLQQGLKEGKYTKKEVDDLIRQTAPTNPPVRQNEVIIDHINDGVSIKNNKITTPVNKKDPRIEYKEQPNLKDASGNKVLSKTEINKTTGKTVITVEKNLPEPKKVEVLDHEHGKIVEEHNKPVSEPTPGQIMSGKTDVVTRETTPEVMASEKAIEIPQTKTVKPEVDQLQEYIKGRIGAGLSPEQLSSRHKGLAMEFAGIKRGLEGKPTTIEFGNAKKYLNTNYKGKKVEINGKIGTVEKTAFGKTFVKFEDGTIKSFTKDEISKPKITDAEVLAYIKTQAEQRLEGQKAIYSDFKAEIPAETAAPIKETKLIKEVQSKPEIKTPKTNEARTPSKEVKTPSKVAKSIEAKSIEKGLTDSFGELAGYDKITIKEQAAKAADVLSDMDRAKRILRGEERLPDGLRAEALIKALEDHAMETSDHVLAMDIAKSPLTSETSAHAQALRLLAERNPDSATARIKEVQKAREQAVREKLAKKGKSYEKAKKETVEQIKNEIAKKKPKFKDWSSFIDSIEC